jgi:hypothetical protein
MGTSKKQPFGIYVCVILVLSLTLTTSSIVVNPVLAQGSGQFPDSGTLDNAGSLIVYSILGVDLSAPNDNGPRAQEFGVWARQFTGTITGGTITVSGTVRENGSGYSAHIAVSVTAGDQTDSDSYDRPSRTGDALVEWDQSFSVSVTVPQGATTASFSIDMVSSHDAGNRENVVYGDFTAQNTGVDHISISSPIDYVNTGDDSFTVTATVFGPENSQVPDGTVVSFILQDKQDGTLGGAKILPQSAETVNSQVTVTFYPPTSAYWSDSTHSDYAGVNTITIQASAGGKHGNYEIVIYNPDNQGEQNNPDNSPDITTTTPPPSNSNTTILIVAGVVIAAVVICVAVVAIKLSAGKHSVQSQSFPPPPPQYQ